MNPDTMTSEPGSYCLVLYNTERLEIGIGRLGNHTFLAGYYLYAGSARGPGGIKSRVGRHLRKEKPLRWHIDFLTSRMDITDVRVKYGAENLECVWAARLAGHLYLPVPGLGASDCRCPGHLLYCEDSPRALLSRCCV